MNLLDVIPDDNQVIRVQKTENQTQNTVSQEPDIDREAQEAMWNERLGNSDDNGISPTDEIDIISDDEVTADEADDYVLNMFRLLLKEAGQELIGDTSLSDFVDEILGTDARELLDNFENESENEFAFF